MARTGQGLGVITGHEEPGAVVSAATPLGGMGEEVIEAREVLLARVGAGGQAMRRVMTLSPSVYHLVSLLTKYRRRGGDTSIDLCQRYRPRHMIGFAGLQ